MNIIGFIKDHGRAICTGLAVAGVAGTAVASANDQRRYLRNKTTDNFELKTAARSYIPTILIGGATIGAIFGSKKLSDKEIAALGAALVVGSKKYHDYREKIVEKYGKDIDKMIVKSIDPYENERTDHIWIRDDRTGEIIRMEEVDFIKALWTINRVFSEQGYISLNDVRELFDMQPVYPDGEDLGWTWNNGYLWIEFNLSSRPGDGYFEIVPEFEPERNYMLE